MGSRDISNGDEPRGSSGKFASSPPSGRSVPSRFPASPRSPTEPVPSAGPRNPRRPTSLPHPSPRPSRTVVSRRPSRSARRTGARPRGRPGALPGERSRSVRTRAPFRTGRRGLPRPSPRSKASQERRGPRKESTDEDAEAVPASRSVRGGGRFGERVRLAEPFLNGTSDPPREGRPGIW